MASTDSNTLGQASSKASDSRRAVGLWLLICAAMVFAMAVIGAITRLTESGLSIMEWAPLMGALPPLTEEEWHRLFALYRETGEYQAHGAGMDLPEFKAIFWWEYIHRLWGRLIGLVFGGGFLWFLLSGRLERRQAGPLALLFALGALQGLVGWYMVASGFSERTDVSQYRLVIHLGLALAIYAALLWTALGLLEPRSPEPLEGPRGGLVAFIVLLSITLLSGGFVAGLDAGLIYNSFPLMGGDILPADYAGDQSWPLNAVENPTAAQFHHRVLALVTLALALLLWLRGRDAGAPFTALALVALLQVGLGIATLLLVVPVWLGALHQAGGILLLTAAIWALHRLTPGRP